MPADPLGEIANMKSAKSLGAAVLAVLTAPAFGYAGFNPHAQGFMQWTNSWFGWLTIGLVATAGIVFVSAVVAWLHRLDARRRDAKHRTAMDSLMAGFVRGEIGKTEFDKRRRQILSG